MKTGIIIKNTAYLLAVNITLWIRLYFVRFLVPVRAPANILLFFIALLLHSMWMTYAFSNNFVFRFEDKRTRRKFFSILAINLCREVVLVGASILPISYRHFFFDAIIVCFWILAYLVVAYDNRLRIYRKRARLACAVGTVILLAACAIGNGTIPLQYTKALQKFTADSPYLDALLKNSEFFLSVKSLSAEILIGILFLSAHVSSLSADAFTTEEYKSRYICKSIVQALLIFNVTLLICLLLPSGKMIFLQSASQSGGTAYSPQSHMDTWNDGVNIYSDRTELDFSNVLYQTRRMQLSKPSIRSETFRLTGAEQDIIYTNGANLYAMPANYPEPHCVKFTVGEDSTYVYGHYAIAYYEQDQPHIVRIENLNNHEYSEVLSGVLRELLADGNLFALEYGGEYLLRYHTDFVMPYIERYKNASFTETENQWMAESFYKESYIINFAASLN